MRDIRIHSNPSLLAQAVAEFFVNNATKTISDLGTYIVLLSGGSTPREVYRRLAENPFRDRLDWKSIYLFWGDERCVPPESADSNYRMVRECLIDKVPIPASNVFRIKGELTAENAASQYEKDIREFFMKIRGNANEIPRFDLVLLGIGQDGHTASIFPGSPAINEGSKLVMAVEHDQPPPPLLPRVTATPPLINVGTQVVFLVTGKAKAERVNQVIMGSYQPERFPAQIVNPKSGRLTWFLDQAAADCLP